jgi:hypothetical protein
LLDYHGHSRQITDYEHTSALRRHLDPCINDAGAQLLQALGAKGSQADHRSASNSSTDILLLSHAGKYLAILDETFVVAKKYQNVLQMIYDRVKPESNGILPNLV